MRAVLALLVALVPSGAVSADPKLGGGYETAATEHALAYEIFKTLNAHSIAVNLEYCGFLYYDAAGELQATPAEKGRPASCLPIRPEGDVRIVASYHTHAAYDAASFNEYPSEQDLNHDFSSRQNGYVATPGGRMWFVERRKFTARQLCGYRCLPYDLRYKETYANRPEDHVTLESLARIFAQGL